MSLKSLRQLYSDGAIEKADFIESMYKKHHHHLFDYMDYIAETDISKIEITDEGVLFSSRKFGFKIYSAAKDFRMAPIEILNFLDYEPDETQMMLNLIPENAKIFDVGANAGWFSILFALKVPRAEVHAFEPIPNTYALLEKNVSVNNINNIEMYSFGFSDKSEDLNFYFFEEGSGNASAMNVSGRESVEKVHSRVERIDDFLADSDRGVDFIKCDVEGAELLVFKGAIETLKKDKPVVFAEMLRKWSEKYDYHPNDIISLFTDIGYRCFTVREGGKLKSFTQMTADTVETNYFFLHEEKHANAISTFEE
jgi:FkbM family methyltransferase